MLKYLGSAWAHFQDYVNVPVYTFHNINRYGSRFDIRRIDMILALGFIICVSYYWYIAGWQWSIIGGLMYIMFLMVALWLI
jgi:hypothetical protein